MQKFLDHIKFYEVESTSLLIHWILSQNYDQCDPKFDKVDAFILPVYADWTKYLVPSC